MSELLRSILWPDGVLRKVCVTCGWWNVYYTGDLGTCAMADREDAPMRHSDGDLIYTKPDFGCNQWELRQIEEAEEL